jgi:anti-sigma B factor antagonist
LIVDAAGVNGGFPNHLSRCTVITGAVQRNGPPPMAIPDSYFDLHVDYATREITVSGEFDVATAGCLATAMAGFHHAGHGDITILLDGVTFIDAAGIGAISRASRSQIGRGARLGVTGATARVRRVFGLGDLAGLLHAC